MSPVYLLLLLIPVISAQTFHWGPCSTPELQSNFTLEPYLGEWYEIAKLPAYFAIGECIQANYSMREDGTVRVLNSQVLNILNGSRWVVEGTAKVMEPKEPAKLGVQFTSFLPYSPYWVVSTDYTTYSVVYSCTDIFERFHFSYAWILSRSPTLPTVIVDYAKKLLIEEGIDISKMTHTDQNCIV
ncbi:apolipoprotein D [Oreochromis niloticus]|uniref:Apolipoprotein D n=1 Tax=Oreochromis niloticus TaxID=8128 RepID=I3JH08_ORENI|nr:apolipoprotein D [Oreochromis niloticus]